MIDDEFEWDDAKASANLTKHGVPFGAARLVFQDAFAVDSFDGRKDYGEDRYARIGMSAGRLLYVAYTMRDERIRVISVRGAEPYEHRRYHEENT
ncbi:MAG: BrnT family toxin [Rhizomicrobium sp.]